MSEKNNDAPRVEAARINSLIEAAEVTVSTIFDKVTLVAVRLANGFVLTESSGAVSRENYSEEAGKQICLEKIKSQLWKLEGYRLQEEMFVQEKAAREVCQRAYDAGQKARLEGRGRDDWEGHCPTVASIDAFKCGWNDADYKLGNEADYKLRK